MSQVTVDIVPNEPIGTISPRIQGHFMEHLGGCIDGGCWVGPDSKIPNAGGVRTDVAAALKAVGAPVIRWPGGCFADDYHWRDGIGPYESRPRRINMHWGDAIEHNGFGTHEFIALCRAVGAEPYLAGNLGSGSPKEMRDWVEYCNFPGGSTLSDERIANGAKDPFKINFWGVGNENWGCGGSFSPEDYGTEYRRYATYLRDWGGTPLYLIACGPNGNDVEWTRRFFTKLRKDFWDFPKIHGFAAHHYCSSDSTATEFTDDDWYTLLRGALKMETIVTTQRTIMDQFDPERKVGLIVDEWGAWHRSTPGTNPAYLWQQSTVRDALVAGVTLDIFNRHCDKVVMANIAQTINVLQSLILTEEEKMLLTPTYHVFDLYKQHQGGESQRVSVGTPNAGGIPQVAASASVKDGVLTITVTNLSTTDAAEADFRFIGAAVRDVAARGIAYPTGDIRAHNTHDHPTKVGLEDKPKPAVAGRGFVATLPAASVTRFTVQL